MMLALLAAGILLSSPPTAAGEERVAPLPQGQRAPFDGWLYSRAAHKRVAADFAAVDEILPALKAKAARARAGEEEAREALQLALAAEAAATARAERLEVQLAERRGEGLLWVVVGLGASLPVVVSLAGDADFEVVAGSGLVSVSGAIFAAWALGD